MASEEHVGPQFMRLYRGEGSHDRPSYYPKSGPDALAGAWWTSDHAAAQNYAASAKGRVYQVDVHESEAEQRGLPHNYVIRDPAVRARRKPLE